MIAMSFSVPFENPGLQEAQGLLRIWILGVGTPTARATLSAHLHRERPKLLIISGFAGALRSGVRTGETFLCENMSDPGVIRSLLAQGWEAPPSAHLFTHEYLAATAFQKTRLRQATGSDLVDMETRSLVDLARFHSVPVITIRTVSDTAAMDFPLPEAILYDRSLQRTRPVILCAYLITHPKRIPSFIRMLRDIFQARSQLGMHLRAVLRVAASMETFVSGP